MFHLRDELRKFRKVRCTLVEIAAVWRSFFDDALAACKKIVDDFLAGIGGKNAEDMYETYCMFGDDPTIYGAKDREPFSGWDYAKQQCQMLCQSEAQKDDTL